MTTTLPHHTSPLRVSETFGQEDSHDIYFDRWEKYSTLPIETQKKLESEEMVATIYKIQKFHNLSDETTANISRMIRGYYFGDLKEFDFIPFLMRQSNINQVAAARLAQLVIKEIIETKPEKTSAFHQNNEGSDQQKLLPLLKALSLYPKLKEHILTEQPFAVVDDENSDQQKGTIKNWIFDYHMNNRGKARRSVTDRDNYLVESKNAKELSEEDRQKVLIILESFDESTPLLIDIKNKAVIFNIIVKTKEVKPQVISVTPEYPVIGRNVSKQASDGEDHFNDKFSSIRAETRQQRKREEIMTPLHTRTSALNESSDQAIDKEMSVKQQSKRLASHMKPIDTTAQQSRTNQAVFTQPQESVPETAQEESATPTIEEEEKTPKTSDSVESPKTTKSNVKKTEQSDEEEKNGDEKDTILKNNQIDLTIEELDKSTSKEKSTTSEKLPIAKNNANTPDIIIPKDKNERISAEDTQNSNSSNTIEKDISQKKSKPKRSPFQMKPIK